MSDENVKVYGEWVSGTEAAEIIGCTEQQVSKLAKLGHLSVKQLPGGLSRKKYLAADARRVAESTVTKAVATVEQTA